MARKLLLPACGALFCILAATVGAAPAPGGGDPAAPAAVSVDLNADLSPISPRIYGQFIEHMGNCIYNGIWAEMLQDRKFFHPVAGAAGKDAAESPSPWSGFGGGACRAAFRDRSHEGGARGGAPPERLPRRVLDAALYLYVSWVRSKR